ncbi:hypothetical protein GDO78_014853 [Eleutherodactylus coqui]|uniref:Uncharacterized protein n=1 Tax=Eleutherodactylus coqui TaxID=57060 RepID=A0A8J6EE74_ELECQ|nr:hypothetical protein GDO78_014853 [Eleutherodactylus coqui]
MVQILLLIFHCRKSAPCERALAARRALLPVRAESLSLRPWTCLLDRGRLAVISAVLVCCLHVISGCFRPVVLCCVCYEIVCSGTRLRNLLMIRESVVTDAGRL